MSENNMQRKLSICLFDDAEEIITVLTERVEEDVKESVGYIVIMNAINLVIIWSEGLK